jgi:osmotically-inducible protein OsmY
MTRHLVFPVWILTLASTAPLAFAAELARPGQPVVQKAESSRDQALARAVLSRILSDNILRYHAGNVQVSARNGWVTLSGSVRRDAIRGRMDLVARGAKGVARVVNLLVVEPKYRG